MPPAPRIAALSLTLRTLLLVRCALVPAAGAQAQRPTMGRPTRDSSSYFFLRPERHGVSYFTRVQHPQVEYKAGDRLSFDRYHSAEVITTWLRRWAEQYPDLVQLYEVGKSYEGRPILQLTITNRKTGAATDKPAAYFEGGRHSGEISGTESALWLAQRLIEGYGKDAAITRLLDRAAVYVRPINNPDGEALYVNTAQMNRSTVRPDDSDEDGLLDEDEAEDLDGDGVLYQIRWKPSMKGSDTLPPNMVVDPRDPSGRLLRPARAGETAVYRWSRKASTAMATAG